MLFLLIIIMLFSLNLHNCIISFCMKTKRFIVRFLKCFIYLICWIFIILVLMKAFNQTVMNYSDLFTTENGLWLWVFALVFSLIYPFYGYCRRKLNANAAENVVAIDSIARKSNLRRVNNDLNAMEYRGANLVKRLLLQFEDKIMVYTDEKGESYVEGPRKEVVRIIFRFDTYLIPKERNN